MLERENGATTYKVYLHPILLSFGQKLAFSHEKFAISGQATSEAKSWPKAHQTESRVRSHYDVGKRPSNYI